jgi:hypothetical protein
MKNRGSGNVVILFFTMTTCLTYQVMTQLFRGKYNILTNILIVDIRYLIKTSTNSILISVSSDIIFGEK